MDHSSNTEVYLSFQNQMLTENVANFFMNFNNIQIQQQQQQENNVEPVNNFEYIDNKALRMMSKMGYLSGTGLGRNKQGIVEPIEVQNNLGRRGLGHVIENSSKETWDFSLEDIIVQEKVEWLYQTENSNVEWLNNATCFDNFIVTGRKITNIIEETKYCDATLVKDVLIAKEVLDGLDSLTLCKARSRANPFETLRSAFFMNRAALKMANIDACADFLFTSVDRQIEHKQSNTPYYFADICAGPGGFSEYILWRKKWTFKGFGLTLKGEHDFKLNASTCAASETFEALYGSRNDGNVYYPENINDFSCKVKDKTGGLGVHFVMGDGGFSVENQENLQEVLSRQIYVCQCLIALNILRPNGHFVVKLFDLFTSFSVGLFFLMYRCFEKVAILKPNSSRPANSERYLICSNFKNNNETSIIRNYLEFIVTKLFNIRFHLFDENLDINEIVPEQIIESEVNFINYIRHSNKRLAEKQLIGLMKLAAFIRDPSLIDPRQDELRTQCLEYWQVPNKLRVSIATLNQLTVDDLLISTILNTDFMFTFAQPLNKIEEFFNILDNIDNWHFTFTTINERVNICNIYASLGQNCVYRFYPLKQRWCRVKNMELVRGTILFGEIVNEFSEEDDNMIKCLHVIDALRLGDTTLTEFSYEDRLDLLNIYCQAVNRESRTDLAMVRVKTVLPLQQLTANSLPILNNKITKYQISVENNKHKKPYYNVNSILLLKTDATETFDTTVSSRRIIYLPNYYNLNYKEKAEQEVERIMLWEKITNILQSKLKY